MEGYRANPWIKSVWCSSTPCTSHCCESYYELWNTRCFSFGNWGHWQEWCERWSYHYCCTYQYEWKARMERWWTWFCTTFRMPTGLVEIIGWWTQFMLRSVNGMSRNLCHSKTIWLHWLCRQTWFNHYGWSTCWIWRTSRLFISWNWRNCWALPCFC